MFSTMTDRSAPRDSSHRETEPEVNDNGSKRRRIESTEDHDHHYRHSASRDNFDAPAMRVSRDTVDTPTVRILTRRYPLTSTGYKHLAIGATVEPPSRVDIVLGDRNGKEICLSPDMWRGLIERKRDVLSCLRSDLADGAHSPAPISIGELTLRFGWINNLPILRMELPIAARPFLTRMEQPAATRLAISLNTLLALYDHRYCVDRIVSALNAVTKEIDAKYSRYREIAANAIKTGTSPKTAITQSEFFDPDNIVDCEIVAICFKS